MKCRHCNAEINLTLVDLCSSPPSNAYLKKEDLSKPETWYTLKVEVCQKCWLVQTGEMASSLELFDKDYAYFSSFSKFWLEHAKSYVDQMFQKFNFDSKSLVIEVASNDGYLLQYVNQKGCNSLGIEPTNSTAVAAREKGIETIEEFFGVDLATKLYNDNKLADLMIANNVLAHVPDINDFIKGFSILLKTDGVATFEFPHLMQLINHNQFDTIYHEHFSYLSLSTVSAIFESNGLSVFDVEEIPTHGGSLRVYAQKKSTGSREIHKNVSELLQKESNIGITSVKYYEGFQYKTNKVKYNFLNFLISAKINGKKVAAYGAAAKGNTLMNFSGVRNDLISFVVDKNPAKQNKYMPGSRIIITNEDILKIEKPDFIVILPWNLKNEIADQLSYAKDWGCQFVTAIPQIEIF
jgi:SAM-dependent methyltransferase